MDSFLGGAAVAAVDAIVDVDDGNKVKQSKFLLMPAAIFFRGIQKRTDGQAREHKRTFAKMSKWREKIQKIRPRQWRRQRIRTSLPCVHTMSSTVLEVAMFVGTSLLFVRRLSTAERRSVRAMTASSSVSKEDVQNLRTKHFSKRVSVSYANSGPLMIVAVRTNTLVVSDGSFSSHAVSHSHSCTGPRVSID